MKTNRSEIKQISSRPYGFTLTELLVVIGILLVMLGLLLPALMSARNRADSVHCTSNARQLVYAWTMYAHDNAENLVINVDGMYGGFTNWAAGNMTDVEDALNRSLLVDDKRTLFSEYIKSPEVYKCPADESPHVRSMAMNCRLNPFREIGGPARWVGGLGSRFRTFRTMNDISFSDRVFVTVDENLARINDGYFAVDMSNTGNEDGKGESSPFRVIDYPANYHSNGANFSFSDGHTELHRWSDTAFVKDFYPTKTVPGSSRDVAWLQAHCTYKE